MPEEEKPLFERSTLGDEVKQKLETDRFQRTQDQIKEKHSWSAADSLRKLLEKIKGK